MGSMTPFPGGVSGWGVPVGAPGISIPQGAYGQAWFVDAAQGGDGSSPSYALSTIQSAIDRAHEGDTIFVFPGTYEESLLVETNYLTIRAALLGGYSRPDIGAGGIALQVSTGQGFVAQGLRFAGGTTDVVIQNANGFIYDDCVFDGDAGMAATEAALRLVPSATDDSYSASEGVIRNSLFRGTTTGAGIIIQHAVAAGGGEGTSDNQLLGNRFVDNGVDLLTATNTSGGGAGIFLRYLIAFNYFLTVGAAYVYGDMDQGAAGDLAANSGLIMSNWFADEALVAAQFDIATQANVIFTGNYDAAGLVNGAAFN